MRKSRFSETQIIKILQEVEAGKSVKDACREYGISDATRTHGRAVSEANDQASTTGDRSTAGWKPAK